MMPTRSPWPRPRQAAARPRACLGSGSAADARRPQRGLAKQRTQTANRLQRLLAELTPGKAKKDITTGQAKEILAGVRPRDLVGKLRRRLTAEQLVDLVVIEMMMKAMARSSSPGRGQRGPP
jgi:hypothetical protein